MRSVTRIMKFLELSFISSHSHFFTLEWLHYVKEGATSFMEKGIHIIDRYYLFGEHHMK